jgi:hypothetical protein
MTAVVKVQDKHWIVSLELSMVQTELVIWKQGEGYKYVANACLRSYKEVKREVHFLLFNCTIRKLQPLPIQSRRIFLPFFRLLMHTYWNFSCICIAVSAARFTLTGLYNSRLYGSKANDAEFMNILELPNSWPICSLHRKLEYNGSNHVLHWDIIVKITQTSFYTSQGKWTIKAIHVTDNTGL